MRVYYPPRQDFPSKSSARMSKSRSVLVLLIAVVLAMSVAVPAEDVPETAYDESEALPYESTSVFSIAVRKAVAPAPAVRTRVPLLRQQLRPLPQRARPV